MPKKENKRHNKGSDDGGSDIQSVSTTSGEPDSNSTRSKDSNAAKVKTTGCDISSQDVWNGLMDQLMELKPGRRLAVIKSVSACLQKDYLPDQVHNWRDTLIEGLANSVSKGTPSEAVDACECLGAALFTVGRDVLPVGLYEDVEKKLRGTSERGGTPRVRGAATEVLGLLAFMGCNDDSKLVAANEFFLQKSSVLSGKASTVNGHSSNEQSDDEAEGTLVGWSLLATLWRTSAIGAINDSPSCYLWDFCEKCLFSGSPSLKAAAGSTVAMIVQSQCTMTGVTTTDGTGGGRGKVLSLIGDITRTSGEGASHRGGLSKIEKRDQSAHFRQVLYTLESGLFPEMNVCIGSRQRTLLFQTWIAFNRYEFLKKYLKGSLASHMAYNPHAAAVIGGDPGFVVEEDCSVYDLKERHQSQKIRQKQRGWLRDQKHIWMEE